MRERRRENSVEQSSGDESEPTVPSHSSGQVPKADGNASQTAESQGAESQGAESQGAESQGAESQGAESQGAGKPVTLPPDSSQALEATASEMEQDSTPPMMDRIDMEHATIGEATRSILRLFNYSTSLPERTIRSATAIAGGLVRESAEWLIPTSFRNSRSYSIFVQQMLDFVVSDLGGVKKPIPLGRSETPAAEVDLARKTVGNLLDLAAFATFHISPITVLSIFSDIAYGSKVYLRQLSERLKTHGLIDQEATIDSAADLIEAVEKASGVAAGAFDQPPISVSGLRKTLTETQAAVAEIDPAQIIPAKEIEQLWRQMELAAEDQHASLWDISTTISMVSLNNIQTAGTGTRISLEIAGDLFQQHIVAHYWEGLREIERKGLILALSNASQPYLEAVWSNFAVDQKTWTEQLLSGELLKWRWSGWSKLSWPKLSREPKGESSSSS
ncbi:MAG: hypothetical protein NXI32_13790 [bacterium]|nr:hypothetical protein [bacterium]